MRRFETEILNTISRVSYARMNMLAAAIGGSHQKRRRELQDLADRGYVRRHMPSGNGDSRAGYPQHWPRIYSLASSKDKFNDHDLSVADLVLSTRAAARIAELPFQYGHELLKGADFRLPATILFPSVDNGKSYAHPIKPDEFFAIDGDPYLLEFDHGTETEDANTFINKKSWLRNLLQYAHIFRNNTFNSAWGIPDLKLLVVFDNPKRMQNVMDLMSYKLKIKSARILFRSYPSLRGTLKRTETGFEYLAPPEPLLTILDDEWQRVGHPPFTIKRRT
jgi:hypothetical protein